MPLMVKGLWRRRRAFPWLRGAIAALLIYACSFDDSDSDSGDSNSDSGGSDSGGSDSGGSDSGGSSGVASSSTDDNGDSMSDTSSPDGRRRRARDAMVVRPDGQPDPDSLSPQDYGDIPPS